LIFTSFDFLIFLVVVFAGYWTLQKHIVYRNLLVLLASYFFYGYWDPRFLFLIAISTSIDFYCGQIIGGRKQVGSGWYSVFFLIASAILFLILPLEQLVSPFVQLDSSLLETILSNTLGWQVLTGLVICLLVVSRILPFLKRLPINQRRKCFLIISIVSNLSILGFFKYFNFFAQSLIDVSNVLFGFTPSDITLNIILPVGISFYTFQTISYSVDIYRKELKPSKNFIEFAAFVSFFPQLVAGPIERGKNLLPQFQKRLYFPDKNELADAVWLIFWGFFKKLVIADNAAKIVNEIFGPLDSGMSSVASIDGGVLLIGVYAFAIQIYCDFSGYTDIARGVAKLFGINLMVNFNLPYFAADPSSFWRRWHISLSSWLRDYLYIPLGGNRGGSFFIYRNLTITMLLGGLWHGASWNFVLWGAFHGLLLSVYRAFNIDTETPNYPKLKRVLMTILFFQFTCFGWLLFRAQNLDTIEHFVVNIFTNFSLSDETLNYASRLLYYCWFLFVFQFYQLFKNNLLPLKNASLFIKVNVYFFIIMGLIALSAKGGKEFIYFAF